MSVELMTVEQFAGCVNETFHAALNDGEIEFVLVEARLLKQQSPDQARAPFTLLFRNTALFLFPQQIYQMRHPKIGEVGIFLVPIAREQQGFLYQAVFN